MSEHVREEQFFRFDPSEHDFTFEGEPVTDELLERLDAMASAPAGAKPATPRRISGLTPGGKSLSGGSKHSPKFQVVLGEATAEKVLAAAKAEGMSVSRWLRRLAEREVA